MDKQEAFLRYSFDVHHAQALHVISDPDNVLGQHIGNGVWTSAQELAEFMCARATSICNRRVLELGAGLGLVGQVKRPGLSLHSDFAVVRK